MLFAQYYVERMNLNYMK